MSFHEINNVGALGTAQDLDISATTAYTATNNVFLVTNQSESTLDVTVTAPSARTIVRTANPIGTARGQDRYGELDNRFTFTTGNTAASGYLAPGETWFFSIVGAGPGTAGTYIRPIVTGGTSHGTSSQEDARLYVAQATGLPT